MVEAVQPVYLVKGDDPALVSQATANLVQTLLGDRSPDMVVEEVHEDADLGAVLDACQTAPFLADRRIIVVRSAGRFRADEVDPLIGYLKAPLASNALIMQSGAGAIPTRLVKAIKDHGHVIDTTVPSGKGRQAWLQDRLRHAPVKLDRSASDRVAEHVTEDFGQLDGVLDALAAAYGEGATVNAEQILPFLGTQGAAAPWELTDAIDAGDTRTALTQLHRMLEGGARHPLVVAATLQKHVTSLLRLDGANVTNDSQAAILLGVAPYPAKKALSQAQRLGSAKIRRAVQLVAEADIDLRGRSAWPQELVLDVLVGRLSKLTTPRRGQKPPTRPAR